MHGHTNIKDTSALSKKFPILNFPLHFISPTYATCPHYLLQLHFVPLITSPII